MLEISSQVDPACQHILNMYYSHEHGEEVGDAIGLDGGGEWEGEGGHI